MGYCKNVEDTKDRTVAIPVLEPGYIWTNYDRYNKHCQLLRTP